MLFDLTFSRKIHWIIWLVMLNCCKRLFRFFFRCCCCFSLQWVNCRHHIGSLHAHHLPMPASMIGEGEKECVYMSSWTRPKFISYQNIGWYDEMRARHTRNHNDDLFLVSFWCPSIAPCDFSWCEMCSHSFCVAQGKSCRASSIHYSKPRIGTRTRQNTREKKIESEFESKTTQLTLYRRTKIFYK